MIVAVKRMFTYILLLLFLNVVLLVHTLPGIIISLLAGLVLSIFYIFFHIMPRKDSSPKRRLRILIGGYELMLSAIICFTLEIMAYLYILIKGSEISTPILITNAIVCGILLFFLLFNGIIRIFTCSSQLGILPRIQLLLFWWMPIVNIILLRKFLNTSNTEYEFALNKYHRNQNRAHEQLCKTKYPILMVHGIFFRDWKNFNYWGRIPKELIDNGGSIYYGNHQSAASVEQCAEELKKSILDIIQKTGCEKVNIIAHSKGGLDTRYAISCLDMGTYVASLTTINTPHMGCNYVDTILKILPRKFVASVGKKYESIYTKLGDDNPDFFNGLKNLTSKECTRLNRLMKDDPHVLYLSTGSRMKSYTSAMFPLNIGYFIIKCFGGGQNDGLVSTKSMVWGDFLGIVTPASKQGISHGDIIDLTRKDIPEFDVCEFYVDLIRKLKQRGL